MMFSKLFLANMNERLLALQNDNLIKHNEKWEAYEK